MAIFARLRTALAGLRRNLDLLALALDYDPHEEQRRRIADLEERLSLMEARNTATREPAAKLPSPLTPS